MIRLLNIGTAIIVLLLSLHATAQVAPTNGGPVAAKTIPPYQLDSSLPAFNIRLLDSATIFNTFNIPDGGPVALVQFMPDCKHCTYFIKELIIRMDSLRGIRFYFCTPTHSFQEIRHYYEQMELANYPNIEVVGRDYEFFYQTHFAIKSVPDVALYEHKKMVLFLDGDTIVTKLCDYMRNRGEDK